MKTQGEYIRTLRRRVDFLKTRDYRNSYDQAELGALEWALVNLPPAQQQPVPENFMDALRLDTAMRDVDAMVAVARADEREACAYRAGIALLGADRGLTNRVDQAIRNRSNT